MLTKTFTLLAAAVTISVTAFAQSPTFSNKFQSAKLTPAIENKMLKMNTLRSTGLEEMKPGNISSSNANVGSTSTNRDVTHTIVGTTYYDLQTNSSVCNRLLNNVDGTVQATWTFSAGNQGVDRGTGYAVYTGGAWSPAPTARIESARTGWPSIARTGSGGEYVIAHNTAVSQLQLSSRSTLGTGTWTENTSSLTSPIPNGNWWPRLAASGDYVHAISITYPVANGGAIFEGQDGALCYSRSSDNGATWDIVNVVPDEVDSAFYNGFSGDGYAIDAKGNTVAIVVGESYTDVVLLKSVDNGATWAKSLVWDFPIDKYPALGISDVNGDGEADTLDSTDEGFSVLIDGDGMCHVTFGYVRVLDDDPTSTDARSYFPGTNGIGYWNESFLENEDPPVIVAGATDVDGSGVLEINALGRYLNSGIALHPNLATDGVNLFLSYTAVVENTDDGFGFNNEHVYVTASDDGGITWQDPVDINLIYDEFSNGAFGDLARDVINNKIQLLYQFDYCAGVANNQDCNVGQEQTIMYVEANVEEFGVSGIVGVDAIKNLDKTLTIYPNPSTGLLTLDFNKFEQTDVTVSVTNSIGQVVKTINSLKVTNNKAMVDLSGMENGIYYVNVTSGNMNTTLPVNLFNN